MKRLGSAALISLISLPVASLSLVACENTSRLDSSVKNAAKGPAEKAQGDFKGDHSGSLEERVARLEANYDHYAEALVFLGKVYDSQKAQQRGQPDPDAVFAVDIAPDVKLGEVEGPNSALVTIVEAWDFA